jgi:hypothetical protein
MRIVRRALRVLAMVAALWLPAAPVLAEAGGQDHGAHGHALASGNAVQPSIALQPAVDEAQAPLGCHHGGRSGSHACCFLPAVGPVALPPRAEPVPAPVRLARSGISRAPPHGPPRPLQRV